MQEHYSTVQIEEMRASIGKIISIAKVREALAARRDLNPRRPPWHERT
jgi:hypothetical protein